MVNLVSKAIYFFGRMIYAPRATTRMMLQEQHKLALGLIYTLGFAFLYSITSIILYFAKVIPLAPVLPLDPKQWYLYQAFYTIPLGLIAVLLFAGVAHALARGLGGTGTWDASFMVLSLGGVLPWFFFTWLPETFYLPFAGGVPFWGTTGDILRQIIPAVWQLILCVVIFQISQRVSYWTSLITVLIGMVPFGLLFAVFIR